MRRSMRVAAAVALALAGLAAIPMVATAQGPPLPLPPPKVHPIQVTGPPAERLNVIILGDGYQWDQQSIFMADVDRNLSVMWATEPFRTYRNYINVYAVEIPSIDYGVRCDPDGRKRHANGTIRDTGEREGPIDGKRTALRMIYQNGRRAQCRVRRRTTPARRGRASLRRPRRSDSQCGPSRPETPAAASGA